MKPNNGNSEHILRRNIDNEALSRPTTPEVDINAGCDAESRRKASAIPLPDPSGSAPWPPFERPWFIERSPTSGLRISTWNLLVKLSRRCCRRLVSEAWGKEDVVVNPQEGGYND
ncbi:hypothetical protein E2P81_ATG06872 [Venturia nashicola]|nr:hypothetical protein E2P81_ATG06872 [Venturia nashicola]